MKTDFSIIIPVYNAADELPDTLATVQAQTYPHFEVVIIDDGSTDSSADIITEWKERLKQPVKILTQTNQGLGAARNAALHACTHPWVALLDADDLWKKDKLEKMAAFMQKEPADIYYHQVENFGRGNRRIRRSYQLREVDQLLERGSPLVPSATIIRRELLEEYPFPERRDYVEDLPLWIRFLAAGKKFALLTEVLGCYREGEGLTNNLGQHLLNVFNVLHDLHEEGLIDKRQMETAKRRKYLEAARYQHKRKNFKEAERYYSAADFKSMKIAGLRFLGWLGVPL